MKEKVIAFLKKNLINAYLEGFGIRKQFPVLDFASTEYEEIKFFIDCAIEINNSEANELVSKLNMFDKDIYQIAYFIFVNNKTIIDCGFDENNNFFIHFNNEYIITFTFQKEQIEPLSITFRKDINTDTYTGMRFFNYEGVVDIEVINMPSVLR